MNWRAALLTAAVGIALSWLGAWGLGLAATTHRAAVGQIESMSSGQPAMDHVDDPIARNVVLLGLLGTAGSLVAAVIVGVALKRKAPPIPK